MLAYLILLFCLVPFIELYLLFALAGQIGPATTLAIVIATGVIGASLARWQGFQVLEQIQREISQQRMPASINSSTASAWPGYCSGSMCGRKLRASMYTA